MGYVACGAVRLDRLRGEVKRAYAELNVRIARAPHGHVDSQVAGRALAASQAAWQRAMTTQCELEDSLLGPGNASAGVMIDCEEGHLRARLVVLKKLIEDVP